MALVDSIKIEAYLDVDAALAGRIEKSVRQAMRYLIDLKGQTWYDDLLDDQGDYGTLTDEEKAVVDAAEHAESILAFYYALPHLNIQADPEGGIYVATWTDDGATKTEKRFATMRSLQALRAEFLNQAKRLIEGDVVIEYGGTESTLVSGVLASVGGGHLCWGALEADGTYHEES